ncbi:hypothetical protein PG993_003476 [Apiospora rasikravindrae]|uniref:Uncharacterized protein n=1 Tax=Apiospora rasikravindrae TaxID=990691 RepID=A0ABR1TZM3_9PEZI
MFPDAVGTVAPGDDPEFMVAVGVFAVLDDMRPRSVQDRPAELGRDTGSRVFGSGNVAPSSMTDRIGGRAGDGVRVSIGAANGARLFACENASVEAVMATVGNLEQTRDSEQWVDDRDGKALDVEI